MKKLNYLLMPLMVVPFLTSCNAKCDKVTEEIWNDAMANKGVDYAQLTIDDSTIYEEGKIYQTSKGASKLSPDVYYIDYVMSKGDEKKVNKTYSWLDSNKEHCSYITSDDGINWVEGGTISVEQAIEDNVWSTPQLQSPISLYPYKEGITYSKAKYTEKGYYIEYEPKGNDDDPDLVKSYIFFKNKKVSKLSYETYDKNDKTGEMELYLKTSVRFSYKKMTPKNPSK